ncbi:MAG: hypothetical protein CMD92_07930, partial [Gammaproteobacteria bacterium]|nr:hypothetical protein [Gammaproteobacteria bacterium]
KCRGRPWERLGHLARFLFVDVTNLKPPPVYKVIVAQVSATAFITVVSLALMSVPAAVSVLLGGIVSSASNAFFAAQTFKHRGARSAHKIVKGFLAGEIGKFFITIVMFALCFSLLPNVIEFAMILSFLTVHVVGVGAAVRINYSPSGHKSTSLP